MGRGSLWPEYHAGCVCGQRCETGARSRSEAEAVLRQRGWAMLPRIGWVCPGCRTVPAATLLERGGGRKVD